jgi:hypothetical protein
VDYNLPGAGSDQSRNRHQQSGFATPRGPNEADKFAGLDLARDFSDCDGRLAAHLSIRLGKILDF